MIEPEKILIDDTLLSAVIILQDQVDDLRTRINEICNLLHMKEQESV